MLFKYLVWNDNGLGNNCCACTETYVVPSTTPEQIQENFEKEGRKVYNIEFVKTGLEFTIDEAKFSVRAGNAVRRKAQELGLPYEWDTLNMQMVAKMAKDGHFFRLRNAGTGTINEIFNAIRKYVGWDEELEMELDRAITGCGLPPMVNYKLLKSLNLY